MCQWKHLGPITDVTILNAFSWPKHVTNRKIWRLTTQTLLQLILNWKIVYLKTTQVLFTLVSTWDFFCYLKKIISNHNTRSYVFDRLKLKQKWLFVARRLGTGAVVGLNISKWLYQISKFLSFGLNIHLNIVTVFRALFQQSSVNLKQGL